jgi:hypothetical protein
MKNKYTYLFIGSIIFSFGYFHVPASNSLAAGNTDTVKQTDTRKKEKDISLSEESEPSAGKAPAVTPSPGITKTSELNNNNFKFGSPLSWFAGLLHFLEIVGLVIVLLGIFRLDKLSKEQKQSNLRYSKDIIDLQNQLQSLQHLLVEEQTRNSIKTGDQNSYLPQTMKNVENVSVGVPYTEKNNQPTSASKTATTYSFLETYQWNRDQFKRDFSPVTVSEEPSNIEKRRDGGHQEMILEEDPQGKYWVFNHDGTTYLLPSPKLVINDMSKNTAAELFDLEQYQPKGSITILKPATVSKTGEKASRKWKLEQKGRLRCS